MAYLVGVTLLWAFSFSLIGVYLAGQVDSYFAVLTRISLALVLFLPWLRPRALTPSVACYLMAVGAVELGMMYAFFYQSFLWLTVPEVLLFTIFTPVYITLIEDLLVARFRPIYLVTALCAVAGAAIIRFQAVSSDYWTGFLLVQGANISFAVGQVAYRRVAPRLPTGTPVYTQFGWFFLGAWPLAALLWWTLGDHTAMPTTATQWLVLLWLGLAASGVGYYAWNSGATRVDAGTLAAMNNALIPAGLAVNLLFWGAETDVTRLTLGATVIIAGLCLKQIWQRRNATQQGHEGR